MHKRRTAVFMSLMLIAGAFKAQASDQNTLLVAPGDLLHIQVARMKTIGVPILKR